VAQLREPEVAEILKEIWAAYKRGGRRQRLTDVKAMPAYSRLVHKIPQHAFLLDNEISLMLDQVRRVNDEPYFLDSDRIGYKVMDTISFEATYGYRTIFAYLKEADKGNLKNKDAILSNVLTMPVSCGQFSYANISPTRILGVSGTLEAMGEYEKDVMAKYGIKTFMYVPSVYGESNFQFDKAGEGICIESNTSDFFHKITDEIQTATMRKRAVIVFFRDNSRMNEFTSSAFYRKLSRQKKLLTEDMSAADKEFVINKAATSGQITVCSAVFGRGTDFFCKDERVQKNGGVHVIQTFLSVERSEEIQIQGRTARQGKKGSYQMVLLESDLEKHFGLCERDKVARRDRYDWLCSARDKYRRQYCLEIETNLTGATEKDRATHKYFDALLAADHRNAHSSFKEIYLSMKKRPMPSTMDLDLAFVIDTTGSMAPFARATAATIKGLLEGSSSIVGKLKSQFPEMQFKLNVAVMGVRDIDDMSDQFRESTWRENSHFTQRIHDAIHFIDSVAESSSGGGDLAEDHLGAIHRCASWNNPGDWASRIKFMMLLTDAPAHGLVPPASAGVANADSYSFRHPLGLTASKVIDKLISKEIDLFMCSFNPAATSRTEKELSQLYLEHPDNTEEREITVIPMVSKQPHQRGVELMGGYGKHIIFILDESGSMSHNWAGVVVAYNQFLSRRRQNQNESDVVSVVQFSDSSRVTVQQISISLAPNQLDYVCGGTLFYPAAIHACQLARETPPSHVPVVVFMSDGMAPDASAAAGAFSMLNREIRHRLESDLELHVIAFGSGVDTAQLQQIAGASRNGKVHSSADTTELSNIFVEIASGQDVAGLLEAEIGKRISEAVTDKLSLEYLA
jgi:Mg-chelatase subunit ChlD